MIKPLHYIADDWYPKSLAEAGDMTAGGRSTFGGGMTSILEDNNSRIIDSQFEKVNPDGTKSKWYSSGAGAKFTKNGNNCNELFKSGGMTIENQTVSAHNMLFEVGGGLDSGPGNSTVWGDRPKTAIRDVMGFSMQWEQSLKDTYSIISIPEKVGLVYAGKNSPFNDTRIDKWIFPAEHKLAGDDLGNKNEKYPATKWCTYSVGSCQSETWQTIKQNKLHWIGVVIQTYSKHPPLSFATTRLNINSFRPIVCCSSDWGQTGISERRLLFNYRKGGSILDCYDGKYCIAPANS